VHDLCPVWGANPSLSGTFIRKLTRRFIPAHWEKEMVWSFICLWIKKHNISGIFFSQVPIYYR
jgi:hypothetical protein